MHGVRSGAVGFCCVLVVGVVSACGEDDPLFPAGLTSGGASGEAGEGSDGGSRAGSGGTSAGGAGEHGGEAGAQSHAGEDAGGSGNSGNGAGEGGEGNTSAGRGGSNANQGGTSGNASGSGGVSGSAGSGGEPKQLQICDRLAAIRPTTALSYDLTMAYERTMEADCRANWVTWFYFDPDPEANRNDRAPFLNTLIHWNLRLWGCQTALPQNFPLIYQGDGVEAVLTRGDAQALIDSYLGVADDMLQLSPSELLDMRRIINRLSEPALLSNSDELSHSACSQNAGGASGMGGQAGSAGTAGNAGSAGLGGASGSSGGDGAGGLAEVAGAGGDAGENGG